ncbi:hypothetical protein O181_071605, partial [Austropuccinia psidii MF-1]|nr:hypothetical protein [Austropuccinia psidii MF-1]
MLEKNIYVGLWPWAFRHVAWVFNRILHNDFIQTPWEIVTGNKPNVAILRMFGCIAYVHDPLHKKYLKAKSRKLIHMGIAQDAKGWIFWCPERKFFVKSLSAVFVEHRRLGQSKANEAEIKSIDIKRVDNDTMINETAGQDKVFSLMSMAMHMGSGAPLSYKEAIEYEQKIQWEVEMKQVLDILEDMKVWQEVPSQGITNVLGSQWVYALKTNEAGEIVRFKARAVVQGHRQIKGINFEENFAPTPTFQSLRGLLEIASAYKWHAATFEVKTAYMNSPLEEEVYIRPPPGKVLRVATNVLKLKKELYGLKQAAFFWWEHLNGILQSIGLSQRHLIKKLLIGNTNNFSPKQPLPNLELKSDAARQADRAYLSKVGMILYLAQGTRPDVMYAINLLAQFSMATSERHWLALKHLISYLAETIEDVLVIEADLGRRAAEMFVDANWGGKGSRSQHGYIGLMWGVPVMWNSKCQSCIESSTFQAEYMALAFGER